MLSQLDIFCTNPVKRYYTKITIHRPRVTCFLTHLSSWKQKYLAPSGSDLNLVITLESFATKNVSSKLPWRWSTEARLVTLLGPI